jgi:hypothetical protein
MTYNNYANTYLPPSPVVPPFLLITAVTNAKPMVVTVSTPNNYVPNQLLRFTVPSNYGMYQLNNITTQILSVDTTNLLLTMDLDSTKFDPFVVPTQTNLTPAPASCAPAGSRNLSNFNTTIESVPFHSLGNFGN